MLRPLHIFITLSIDAPPTFFKIERSVEYGILIFNAKSLTVPWSNINPLRYSSLVIDSSSAYLLYKYHNILSTIFQYVKTI